MFNYDFEKAIEMPDLNTIPELLHFKTSHLSIIRNTVLSNTIYFV